jgi:hypothetical protein
MLGNAVQCWIEFDFVSENFHPILFNIVGPNNTE